MAKYSERNTTLREHSVTENELQQLKLLDWDEAVWRMDHERKVMHEWVDKRFDFIKAELEKARPTMPKYKPVITGEPGIVSHRGRGTVAQHYGEKFG